MNVFYTNDDPIQAAHEHCYVHVVKMIVEYAQLLSTAHHVLDKDEALEGIYKLTHCNHPSAVWTRECSEHYNWVHTCAMELCAIYTQVTGKTHKTQVMLELLSVLPKNIESKTFKQPPVAAPDEFKALAVFNGATVAYQKYLCAKFKEWLTRAERPIKVEFKVETPHWYE